MASSLFCAAAKFTNGCHPRTLKVALDVHLAWHVAAFQYAGSCPKPPQLFSPAGLLAWLQKQLAQGWQVITCYEAGPFGYTLHRQLTALGVTNHVIRPRHWDNQHKRVKTDRTDALAMLNALDRFVAGNRHALAIRIPSEAEQHLREGTRRRRFLQRLILILGNRGHGQVAEYAHNPGFLHQSSND